MSKASKFAGAGKVGKTAYASQVAAQYSHLTPSKSNSSTADNRTSMSHAQVGSSSHNDINRFVAGIHSRGGGYNNPKGTYETNYQQKNTENVSKPHNPSGASKVNQKVPNKKVSAPDRYNPRTPNMMKMDGSGRFFTKASAMQKLGNNMKKK